MEDYGAFRCLDRIVDIFKISCFIPFLSFFFLIIYYK